MSSLKPQLSLPVAARKPMLLAAPMLVAVWALAGFYGSLVPALMHKVFGLDASFAGGMAVVALTGGGVAAVLALQSRAARALMNIGGGALIAGTLGIMLSLEYQSALGFFLGTILAGGGFGAGFQGGIRTVVPAAKPHERAGVLSVAFVVCYLAMGLPAVIAGFFVVRFGNLLITAQQFSAAVILLAVFALLGGLLAGRGATPAVPAQ